MKKLTNVELEDMHHSLNDVRRTRPSFLLQGVMLMRCDSELGETKKDMEEHMKPEQKRLKNYFIMELT